MTMDRSGYRAPCCSFKEAPVALKDSGVWENGLNTTDLSTIYSDDDSGGSFNIS